MITWKQGDLLQAEEPIIAHQVNCCGVAGGLAASVFRKWPDAGNDYFRLIDRIRRIRPTEGGGRILLGYAQLTGQQKDGHIIANLYGQYYAGEDYRPDALERALEELGRFARDTEMGVALPYRLSCGICGGDWDEVLQIIERTMEDVDCAIYQREQDK